MPTDATPEPGGPPAAGDALTKAIAELRAEQAPASGEPEDRYWLRVGIGLGLRQPGRASLLLDGLETRATRSGPAQSATAGDDADAEAPVNEAASDTAAGIALTSTAAAPTASAPTASESSAADQPSASASQDSGDRSADGAPQDPDEVPVRSWLLARSSGLDASADAETVFGWVEQLTPTDIRRLGNTLTSMLAGGASRDLERGFGLAWSAGTRLPREDLRRLFGRFSELELAVCSTLGGRDLLSIPQPPEASFSALLAVFVRRSNPAVAEASAILEREGDPGRRALVAIWNAWIAMRYRELIAPPLFEQLVRAWVTVVGRLPEP